MARNKFICIVCEDQFEYCIKKVGTFKVCHKCFDEFQDKMLTDFIAYRWLKKPMRERIKDRLKLCIGAKT